MTLQETLLDKYGEKLTDLVLKEFELKNTYKDYCKMVDLISDHEYNLEQRFLADVKMDIRFDNMLYEIITLEHSNKRILQCDNIVEVRLFTELT